MWIDPINHNYRPTPKPPPESGWELLRFVIGSVIMLALCVMLLYLAAETRGCMDVALNGERAEKWSQEHASRWAR